MRNLRRILVPDDFSECSSAALDYAAFLAEPFGAEIDLLYVWNPRTSTWNEGRSISLFFADSPEGMSMERRLSNVDNSNVTVRGRVQFGELSSTIATVANSESFDLIVMGLHGRQRLTHWFSGHVAQKVAKAAHCPVMTVRASMGRDGPPLEPRGGYDDDDSLVWAPFAPLA